MVDKLGPYDLNTIICGDCIEVMPTLEENSVDLIFVDWPYYRVKNEPWDRQWDKPEQFLEWIGQTLKEAKRILKPNGSFYGCASPDMSRQVETKISEYFKVLNNIRWYKDDGWHKKNDKEAIRQYLKPWEAIIFAEQYWSDETAAGESGYYSQCKALHKDIYAPVFGVYLQSEFERAGVTRKEIATLFPSRNGNLTGCVSNWVLGHNCPTEEQYTTIRDYLNSLNCKTDYLRREYEDLRREYEDLRREYEDLRREYEDLRRPFNANPDIPYTDIWTFKPVKDYPGKHPTEKPLAMLEHIINISSRPGDTVLDFCMGAGTTLVAAQNLERKAIGIDAHKPYCDRAKDRIRQKRLFSVPINHNGVTPKLNGKQLELMGSEIIA